MKHIKIGFAYLVATAIVAPLVFLDVPMMVQGLIGSLAIIGCLSAAKHMWKAQKAFDEEQGL